MTGTEAGHLGLLADALELGLDVGLELVLINSDLDALFQRILGGLLSLDFGSLSCLFSLESFLGLAGFYIFSHWNLSTSNMCVPTRLGSFQVPLMPARLQTFLLFRKTPAAAGRAVLHRRVKKILFLVPKNPDAGLHRLVAWC